MRQSIWASQKVEAETRPPRAWSWFMKRGKWYVKCKIKIRCRPEFEPQIAPREPLLRSCAKSVLDVICGNLEMASLQHSFGGSNFLQLHNPCTATLNVHLASYAPGTNLDFRHIVKMITTCLRSLRECNELFVPCMKWQRFLLDEKKAAPVFLPSILGAGGRWLVFRCALFLEHFLACLAL